MGFVIRAAVGMLASEDVALGPSPTITYWAFIGGRFIPPFNVLPGPEPLLNTFYESDTIGEGLLS